MDSVLFEIRYAARRLRQAPVFTLVVVLTLALGIGANSAIFSVIDTVLLHALPYREPDRLVALFHHYSNIKLDAPISAPGFKDYRDRTHSFSGVAVETGWGVNLTGIGEPQRLRGTLVSAQFFSVLAAPPALGRTFREDEDALGHEHEVVLSDGAWRRLYGADPTVTTKKIELNGEPYDIIGVMPPEFIDPRARDVDLWRPIAFNPAIFSPNNYTNEFLALTARLKPGVTLEQASRDMAAFSDQLRKELPSNLPPVWSIEVKSLAEVRTGAIRPALLVLLGAVGFVLLIACANVANLLLARAAARQKEVAIRTALGARTGDLVRQLLTESVMLSLIGGACGLLIAYGSVQLLAAMNPGNIPGIAGLHIDPTVVLFTAIISVITGLLFGLVPALQMSHTNLHVTLKEGGRSNTADRSGLLVRRTLVVAEVALALTLLTGGGLLLRSFARLADVDPGFNPRGVMTFSLSLPQSKYGSDTAVRALYAALIPGIEHLPGVVSAGVTSVLPFGGGGSAGSFNVEGYTPPPNGSSPWGDIRNVSSDFHKTLQIPLLRGRFFDDRDSFDNTSASVAIVDDEFVRRFYKP
jgi:putative ABC transport system permease protein